MSSRKLGWLLLGLLSVLGCDAQHAVHSVDADQARATLKRVLQSWQQGRPIDWWRAQEPEVVVQDMDWRSGAQLEQFEILPQDEAVDANLYCKVMLTLRDAERKPLRHEVTYLVGTHPKLRSFVGCCRKPARRRVGAARRP